MLTLPSDPDALQVLFVCVHNAARSRMAEALLRAMGGPSIEVTSAGFDPQAMNPLAIEAMVLAGLPVGTTAVQPSVFDLYRAGRHFHYVISVCDESHGQRCPLFPGVTQRLTWNFPDPTDFVGTREAQLAQIIDLREALRARIATWLETLSTASTDTGSEGHRRN